MECQTNCLVATTIHPPIDHNQMKGTLYFDLSARYRISANVMAYVKIDNLTDRTA